MIGRKMIAGKVGRAGASTRVERRDFLKFSIAASGGLLIVSQRLLLSCS